MKLFLSELRTSAFAVLSLACLVCGVYPLTVWSLAETLFPYQSDGSLIIGNGGVAGSALIGRNFAESSYFHPRPSYAGEAGYDATKSGGGNLGPLSGKLITEVKRRVEAYRVENEIDRSIPVPADAVTASASGLDPHISARNAELQAARVAKTRRLSADMVKGMILRHTRGRDLGFLGEIRVNVLTLNLELDRTP